MSLAMFLVSCMHDYLDYKPDKKLVVPSSYQDLRAILDNGPRMNIQMSPFIGEISSDDFWVEDDRLSSGRMEERAAYLWEDFVPEEDVSWKYSFSQIFYANVVLERAELLDEGDGVSLRDLEQLKGQALFHRAWAYFQLSQLYSHPYSEETAHESLGIPLRLESDINVEVTRPSLETTYQQIIKDATAAAELMSNESFIQTRPNKVVALALLAKVYMQMHQYDNAYRYANEVLANYNVLLDYNMVDAEKDFPFSVFNEEVVWHCTMLATSMLATSRLNVDTNLYELYGEGDLRKELFFDVNEDGLIKYKGSYSESQWEFFAGIAIDEIYLIRAECAARIGNTDEAVQDLVHLMSKRFAANEYEIPEFQDQDDLLRIIINERRKELIFRGIRWHDLRRLNSDPAFATVLKRNYQGKAYQLLPESPKYTLPIPMDEVELSGIEQN